MEILLAMAHAGALGDTATQIQQTVHLPETRETSAKLYGQLMDTLINDGNVTLNLANGIFADKDFTIKKDYLVRQTQKKKKIFTIMYSRKSSKTDSKQKQTKSTSANPKNPQKLLTTL